MPPNSDAVVSPIGTAPAVRRRATLVESWSAISSRNVSDASVAGQPATSSSSFTPMGTPPNGRLTSAPAAARRASSGSRYENALMSERSMAARVASSSSTGERSPVRNASTSETASPDQGVSVMTATLSPVRSRLCETFGRWLAPGQAPNIMRHCSMVGRRKT